MSKRLKTDVLDLEKEPDGSWKVPARKRVKRKKKKKLITVVRIRRVTGKDRPRIIRRVVTKKLRKKKRRKVCAPGRTIYLFCSRKHDHYKPIDYCIYECGGCPALNELAEDFIAALRLAEIQVKGL